MKIAVGLSELAFKEILEEYNHHCKERYKTEKLNHVFKEELNNKIDCTITEPRFHYEIPSYQTNNGAPYLIELYGHEYFNWLSDCENEKE